MNMKRIVIGTAIVATFGALGPGVQAPPAQAGGAGSVAEAPLLLAAAETHEAEGTVKAIQDGRIQLDHGPIKSLGWGAMVMFFDVEHPDLLEGLKPGDRVRFELTKTRSGGMVIVDIEPLDQ